MSKRPPTVDVMFCPQFRPLVGGAERYLSPELIYRREMGFGIPVAHWLCGRLAPLIEEVLFDARLMELLNSVVIRKTVKEFREQHIDHSSRLWGLLMYGLWKKICYAK